MIPRNVTKTVTTTIRCAMCVASVSKTGHWADDGRAERELEEDARSVGFVRFVLPHGTSRRVSWLCARCYAVVLGCHT